MQSPRLIPPKLPRPSIRQFLLAGLYGAVGGGVLGLVAWLATGELYWFRVVPLAAGLGLFALLERSNVLWGHRVRS